MACFHRARRGSERGQNATTQGLAAWRDSGKAWRHGGTAVWRHTGAQSVCGNEWRHGVKAGGMFAAGGKAWRHGGMAAWRHCGGIDIFARRQPGPPHWRQHARHVATKSSIAANECRLNDKSILSHADKETGTQLLTYHT